MFTAVRDRMLSRGIEALANSVAAIRCAQASA
ncbi:hypothetical protein M2158_005969 [Streptomyces sp. SAI-144]|nr:hypothetical protein [Streptomyces sp. SAI-144]MDH6484853.1 hypothetical protein [Streptomyces sp. SAI-127]